MQDVETLATSPEAFVTCAKRRIIWLGPAARIARRLTILSVIAMVAGWPAGITAAASDCPCRREAGSTVCVPDPDCEARERETHHWRREAAPPRASPPVVAAPPRIPELAPGPQPPSVVLAPKRAPELAPSPPPPDASPAARPSLGADPGSPTAGHPRILETGFALLSKLGRETTGYGLYSYAILPSDSSRAAAFLGEVFKDIPSIDSTAAKASQLNILYLPIRAEKVADFPQLARTVSETKLGAAFASSFYDYRAARALLDHICNPPADAVRALCDGDMSQGPYVFTYAAPASNMDSVPPPFLLVDLSEVHPRAFGELIAAFRAQVKRDDISDQARIRTLRLTILQITLTAADWISPVQKALADIVHATASDHDK